MFLYMLEGVEAFAERSLEKLHDLETKIKRDTDSSTKEQSPETDMNKVKECLQLYAQVPKCLHDLVSFRNQTRYSKSLHRFVSFL